MRSKRTPDRVHVVRTPEQDGISSAQQEGRSLEIVRMLAQIGDKLKRSEAERYELLRELREYRKSLRELEDKTENSEKAYLAIENKLKTKGNVDTESLERQARMERSLKNTEEKLVKAVAGQALIDKRLKDTEEKQTMIDQRLDESAAQQTRIDRQLELSSQDRSRLVRKLERLEEMMSETKNALSAKAMVLLTDKSTTAQAALAAPVDQIPSTSADVEPKSMIQRMTSFQTLGTASMIVAALLGGWAINQVQQPNVPQIAVLENGGLAKLNLKENKWEPVAGNLTDETTPSPFSEITPAAGMAEGDTNEVNITAEEVVIVPDENPDNVLDLNDDQLLEALETDPDGLATQLNEIAPGATNVDEPVQEEKPAVEKPQAQSNLSAPSITPPMKNFDRVAFQQDTATQRKVLAEKPKAPIAERVKPDSALPEMVKKIEQQAFAGNAEAQHDLAAIYTAGHGGVDQDFKRAAIWFREAADNKVANARYNLGVLHHQGLGQKRDLDRALYWYREAAKLEHAEAQYNLGIAHIEGIGTEYNPPLAAAFFEKAANNGVMEAAYNLGLIYENGLLGKAKPNEALLWYKIAADQGVPDAKSAMEGLVKTLQIDMKDVDNLVERMQEINESVKGRRAGPQKMSSAPVNQQAVIAQIQEFLMLTGDYTGPADGIFGPNTEKAIRSYQATYNLSIDGKPTKALLNHMVSGAASSNG